MYNDFKLYKNKKILPKTSVDTSLENNGLSL